MPTMFTFRPGRAALIAVLLGLFTGCSSEQQDWSSAQGADTSEAWGRFLEQHPDSELAAQARLRIAQLTEQRDWQHAGSVGTPEAYRGFLAQHPNGKWSGEARIRIEAFALGSAPRTAPQTPEEAAQSRASWGVNALQLARGATPASTGGADTAVAAAEMARPGEAAAPAAAEIARAGEAAEPAAPVDTARSGQAVEVAAVDTERRGETGGPAPVSTNVAVGAVVLPGGGYGVQLGAFATEASADREWQRLQGRFGAELGGLSPRIVVASTDSGQLYRLQATAAGEAQARAICDSLKEQAQACVPVIAR
jgi:SPOR domain